MQLQTVSVTQQLKPQKPQMENCLFVQTSSTFANTTFYLSSIFLALFWFDLL